MLQEIDKQTAEPLGLYVHWPYCLSKCPYCDFNSHVSDHIDVQAFAESYKKELDYFSNLINKRPLQSIFFGGGTPSLMPPSLVERIIGYANDTLGLEQGCEITLEANPTSYETDKFKAFKSAGINRVSIGVQSLNDNDLKFLGRQHSKDEALHAIKSAQTIFDRLSFDLIYARPEQTVQDWKNELKTALDYGTTHLSLYQLTIEKGTAFHTQYNRGEFSIPDEFLAADLYEATQEIANSYGLPAYETSNHAAMGEESRHNLIYWRYNDYLGIGPGAHGRFFDKTGQKQASRTHLAPEIWLERCNNLGHGAHKLTHITKDEAFIESVMMGLRLREGIPLEKLSSRLEVSWHDLMNIDKLDSLKHEGLLELSNNNRLKTTDTGTLCVNTLLNLLLN